MEIGGETEDSQSSPETSSRLTTPLPLTPVSRPTPGKRMQHSPKNDPVEEKLLEIIQKPESKPDEEELFCLSLGCKAEENQRLQLQQTLYNCMYGDAPQPQPQQMPQQLPQQFPTLMAHQQSSSSSGLQSYDYTMSSDGSTFTSI